MTLQEALDLTDEMKPNMMTRNTKIRFLKEIEQLIYHEIILKHHHAPGQYTEPDYSETTDPGTVLIVPDTYAMVYVYWIMSKIDMLNQEDARYMNDRALFENAYGTFSDYWTREHMPIGRVREIRI